MNNKTITIYELVGLIKDGKVPKKIEFDNYIFTYISKEHNYRDNEGYYLFGYHIIDVTDFLNNTVEILPEENDEWEDIEELYPEEGLSFTENAYEYKINQLIKNQRKIIEKLDKNEIMFDYYVEKLEAKEKLESKDE